MRVEVDDIVLFGPTGIEGSNAAIIQVEADGYRRPLQHLLPLLPVLADVLHHEHGLLTAACQQTVADIDGSGYDQRGPRQMSIDGVFDGSMSASGHEIFVISREVHHDVGLHMVSQSEVQPPGLVSLPRIVSPNLAVSVVGAPLVDHIPDKTVVSWRLYAKTATVMDASEPDQNLCHSVHKRKVKYFFCFLWQ